jgi:Mrp family chromosome partitioning ATPase
MSMKLNASREMEQVFTRTLGQGHRVIGFTGPKAGVGVSTVAAAFAERSALGGRKTLLITLSAPLSDSLGCGWDPLTGGVGQNIAQLSPDLHKLDIRPSREEQFAFRNMPAWHDLFTNELKHYHTIVLDLHPVLASDDVAVPAILGACLCDSVIIVCGMGYTTSSELSACISDLAQAQANLEGVVINDCYNPTLGEEMAREAGRLKRLMPKVSNFIVQKALSNAILNLRT